MIPLFVATLSGLNMVLRQLEYLPLRFLPALYSLQTSFLNISFQVGEDSSPSCSCDVLDACRFYSGRRCSLLVSWSAAHSRPRCPLSRLSDASLHSLGKPIYSGCFVSTLMHHPYQYGAASHGSQSSVYDFSGSADAFIQGSFCYCGHVSVPHASAPGAPEFPSHQ